MITFIHRSNIVTFSSEVAYIYPLFQSFASLFRAVVTTESIFKGIG